MPPKHCQWNFYNSVVSKYIVDTYFKTFLYNNRLILFLPLQKVIQITTRGHTVLCVRCPPRAKCLCKAASSLRGCCVRIEREEKTGILNYDVEEPLHCTYSENGNRETNLLPSRNHEDGL